MPGYPGNNLATLLYENRQGFLYQNESVRAGERSVAFQLRRVRGDSYPFGASFGVSFSGDPGAFAIDIQIADTDEDANYVTVAQLATASSSYTTRYDMTTFWPRFVRVLVNGVSNSVNTTVTVTR